MAPLSSRKTCSGVPATICRAASSGVISPLTACAVRPATASGAKSTFTPVFCPSSRSAVATGCEEIVIVACCALADTGVADSNAIAATLPASAVNLALLAFLVMCPPCDLRRLWTAIIR